MSRDKIDMFEKFFTKCPKGIDLRNDSIRLEDHCEETKLKWEDE
jgi:hypothetical protein